MVRHAGAYECPCVQVMHVLLRVIHMRVTGYSSAMHFTRVPPVIGVLVSLAGSEPSQRCCLPAVSQSENNPMVRVPHSSNQLHSPYQEHTFIRNTHDSHNKGG